MATTVLPTEVSSIGNASQEPVTAQKKATIACMSVTDVSSTARTAAARTGSGNRRRPFSSSTHNCPADRASWSIVSSLPTAERLSWVAARIEPLYADTPRPVDNDGSQREKVSPPM
ncbi:hypothetical protein GCM10010272_22140 [Streptomyces lateritius]|nr:hypothetical protein GCM10010272_22140 [Streptomyces lateritius]